MADIWPVEKRGISYGFVTFAPLLGIAVGPILGGFISEGLDWSWLFWIVSAWDAALVVLSIFLFHESYAPVLLARRTKKFHQTIPTLNSPENEAFTKKLQVAMFRPIQMLFTQPIVPLVSLFLAYNFGIYCIVMTTFSNIWMQKYHESSSISGLNYIAIAIGSTIASQGGGWATDKLWAYLKAKAGGVVKPEYRVPLMIPGTILMPIGLFCTYYLTFSSPISLFSFFQYADASSFQGTAGLLPPIFIGLCLISVSVSLPSAPCPLNKQPFSISWTPMVNIQLRLSLL